MSRLRDWMWSLAGRVARARARRMGWSVLDSSEPGLQLLHIDSGEIAHSASDMVRIEREHP